MLFCVLCRVHDLVLLDVEVLSKTWADQFQIGTD